MLKPLTYTEYAVRPALAEYILCGWSFAADSRLEGIYPHCVVPDGCISIVYNAGSTASFPVVVLTGPRTKQLRVDVRAGDQYWGIKLWPDAGGALLGIDPGTVRDRAEPLALHAPVPAELLSNQLRGITKSGHAMEAFQDVFATINATPPPLDILVRRSLHAIGRSDGLDQIQQIAAALGLSQRQLQRRFKARVGLTPKEYARIRRLRVALANAIDERPKRWGEVAAETGFADQSHLSRDAVALAGRTPVAFEAHIEPIKHYNVDP